MLRVVRILHLFRINSHYDAFLVITEVLKEKEISRHLVVGFAAAYGGLRRYLSGDGGTCRSFVVM
jgi:hypothetical protein